MYRTRERPDVHPGRTADFAPERAGHASSQLPLFLGVVALVGCLDQGTKAWAWRNLTDVHINSGGDMLVGSAVSSWYRDRALGAALDVLAAALLVTAGLLLTGRRRAPVLAASGALALAGWASNLGDRLGLHFWTAPGSRRGVVDFVPWDGRYWNLADLAIIAGTAVFVLAVLWHALRAVIGVISRGRRPTTGQALPSSSTRPRPAVLVTAVVVTAAVLAGFGAGVYSGASTPTQLGAVHSSATAHPAGT